MCVASPSYDSLSLLVSLPTQPLTADYRVAEVRPLTFLHDKLQCKMLENSLKLALTADGTLPLNLPFLENPRLYLLGRHVNQEQLPP